MDPWMLNPPCLGKFIKKEEDEGSTNTDASITVQESRSNQDPSSDCHEQESDKLPPDVSDCYGNNQSTMVTCMSSEGEVENLLHYKKNDFCGVEMVIPKRIDSPQSLNNIISDAPPFTSENGNQITVHVSSVLPEGNNGDLSEEVKTEPGINLTGPNKAPTGEKAIESEQIDQKAQPLSQTAGKAFICFLCNKSFSHQNSLTIHIRTHTGEKPFKCGQCGKSFYRSCDLKMHIMTHSGEKPFTCGQCGKFFSQQGNLKRHIRTHTGEKPYNCEHCGQSFGKPCNLKDHMREHTGEKPFKCEQCGESFSQHKHLKAHVRTHTGKKPFKCGQCGKSFSRPSDLKMHIRTHTGEKPFKCGQCGKCFSQHCNLNRHIRTHNGEKPFEL